MQGKSDIRMRRAKSVGYTKNRDMASKSLQRADVKPAPTKDLKKLANFKMPAVKVQKSKASTKNLKKSQSSSDLKTAEQAEKIQDKPTKKLKYRNLRRVTRPEDDISLDKLAERLTSYSLLEKRDPNEMSPGLFEGHKLNYQNNPSTSRKPRKNAKTNKLLAFESDRLKTLIRCVKEEDCMQIDDKLKTVFHKGILNEDNDTDESEQQTGVARSYNNLKKALRTYKLRNTANRQLAENAQNSHLKKQQKRLHDLMIQRDDTEDSYNANNKPVKNLKKNEQNDASSQYSMTEAENESYRKDSNEMIEESKTVAVKNMNQEITKAKRR